MMIYIFMLSLIPIAVLTATKFIFHKTVSLLEWGCGVLISVLFVAITVAVIVNLGLRDVEVWNGHVIKKEMIRKSCPSGWTRSPSSFCSNYVTRQVKVGETCSTDSNGNRSCIPIYVTEYNYTYSWEQRWYVYSTLETFEIARIDSRGVKQPPRWTEVNKNDPVSVERSFINYVKASSTTMFNHQGITDALDVFVPPTPRVYDYYKYKRVVTVGAVPFSSQEIDEFNFNLGKAMNTLGPQKQSNVIVFLTNIADPTFRYNVERKWVGGAKNDIVVFVGLEGEKVLWADVMTWAGNYGNELFAVQLRNDVLTHADNFDPELFVQQVSKNVLAHYDRPQMKDFEYLKKNITPTTKQLVVTSIILLIMSVLMSLFFHQNDTIDSHTILRSRGRRAR